MSVFAVLCSLIQAPLVSPVPYALNQVMLYGIVATAQEEVSAGAVEVCIQVKTEPGESGFAVYLHNRRALELLAFRQAHLQIYPDEPFLVSVIGRLAHMGKSTIVVGEAITFHVSPDVRVWGGRLVGALLGRYVMKYGRPEWLASPDDRDEAAKPVPTAEVSHGPRPKL